MRRFIYGLLFLALAAPVQGQETTVDTVTVTEGNTTVNVHLTTPARWVFDTVYVEVPEIIVDTIYVTETEFVTDTLFVTDTVVVVDTVYVDAPPPPPDTTTPPPPPSSGAVDWFSDWRGRSGNSSVALHDGGKWNDNLCTDTHLVSIVSAAGRDFPAEMDRAYRYEIPPNNQCYLLMASNQWRAPAVGESAFYRWYMRFEAPAGHAPQDQHFFHQGQYHSGPQYESTFWLNGTEDCRNAVCADGRYRVQLVNDWFRSDPSWHNIELRTYETYRFELRMWRETAGTARYWVRVFDSAGNELGPDAFRFEYYGPQGANELHERVQQVASADSHFRVIQVGYNGSSPTGNFAGGVFNYIGGVAVRITSDPNGWIGPYTRDGG